MSSFLGVKDRPNLTGAQIKSAYEAEADTNGFTDDEKQKLSRSRDAYKSVLDLALDSSTALAEGTVLSAGVFEYQVVASGAPVHHLTTAGGMKLKAVPLWVGSKGGIWNLAAFGPKADYDPDTNTGTDDTDVIQGAIDALASEYDYAELQVSGVHRTTRPIIVPVGISLRGADPVGRGMTRQSAFWKTTNTQSSILAERSITSTQAGDGFDGVDHYPDCIVHLTETPTTDGAWSGNLVGLYLDGSKAPNPVQWGVYARRVSNASINHNFIEGCDNGFSFWNYIYLTEFRYNYIRNVKRGVFIDSATSLEYHGNYINTFSVYGHKLHSLIYSSVQHNAVDKGAVGETASYAIAYDFDNCDGTEIANNGCEGLNGTFIKWRTGHGCSVHDNICIGYDLTYTGGDTIGAVHLNYPLADFERNKVVFLTPVAKADTHLNLYVENTYTLDNFGWADSNVFADNIDQARSLNNGLEKGFGRSTVLTAPKGYGSGVFAGNRTLYVRSGGDDAADGSSTGEACATIQGLIDKLPREIHSTVTIDIGAGTFAATEIKRIKGTGKIVLQGAGIASTTLTGANTFADCEVSVDVTDCKVSATGGALIHVTYANTNGLVYDCDYNTDVTGTSSQFVRGEGNSRVGVYSNTYTSTSGANLIRAEDCAHMTIDSATNAAISSSAGRAGRVSLAGKETSL